MTHRSDAKAAAVGASTTATVDAWHSYLVSKVGHGGHVADLEFEWLSPHTGARSDRWFAYLGSTGMLGALVDRLRAFWIALLLPPYD